jgi:hypothetical protein
VGSIQSRVRDGAATKACARHNLLVQFGVSGTVGTAKDRVDARGIGGYANEHGLVLLAERDQLRQREVCP